MMNKRKNTLKQRFIILVLLLLSVVFVSCSPTEEDNITNSVVLDEKPDETSDEKPVDTTDEKTVETSDEKPVETPNEKTVETPDGKPAETPVEVVNILDDLKIYFLDVGQGDSVLIQVPGNHNILIDAGNNGDDDYIYSYLKQLGIETLDYVIGTHPHEDHIGSIDMVINNFNVKQIIMPNVTKDTKTFSDVIKAMVDKGLLNTNVKVGDEFDLGEAKFTILAPNSNDYSDVNDHSIVIKLEYDKNSFIFTGDAETVSEHEMVASGMDLSADLLKVANHGSGTSTTAQFLKKVSPTYAVISVGEGNKYGHPDDITINRLVIHGVDVYRTDKLGTIVVTSDGNTIEVDRDTTVVNLMTPPIENKAIVRVEESEGSTQDISIPPVENIISFPDSELEEAIRSLISKPTGDIYTSDVEVITELSALNKGISNLEGIQHLVNIRNLYLTFNNISDISPLSSLTKLEKLSLTSNNISDISSLSNLANLKSLTLGNNQISDISTVKDLTSLYNLGLGDNKINNIDVLSNLINLKQLGIENNSIIDVRPLISLSKLEYLLVSGNNIKDISPLSKHIKLYRLSIDHNQISDLSPISNLINLKELYVHKNLIYDISPLSNLTQLKAISLTYNSISNIKPLGNLTNLKDLHLYDNNISDISALRDLTNLKKLSLGMNDISNIDALRDLTNLTSLSIISNNISDIDAIKNMTNLKKLDIRHNDISDISKLENLNYLTDLFLDGNPITDYSPVASYYDNLKNKDF